MAQSKCIKCNGITFEMVENTPLNSNFKLMFVQCQTCGTVVGVLPYENAAELVRKLTKKIDSLPHK